VFPTNISTIDLNYDTTDTIQEFTVEMQVQWWEAIKGTGPNAGGQDIFWFQHKKHTEDPERGPFFMR